MQTNYIGDTDALLRWNQALVCTATDSRLYNTSLWAAFQKNSGCFRANSRLYAVELATLGTRRPCTRSGRQFLIAG
jgi:hypothetical protein